MAIDTFKEARVAIIGVGGGGNNAVDRIIEDSVNDADMQKVKFISVNTDYMVLKKSKAPIKVPLGDKLTKGRGCGAKPEIGKKAAEESLELISKTLDDVDMVFITAGMGGGTGTGAAPIVADIAKKKGILTVAVVTKPYSFEGSKRIKAADEGVEELLKVVDSLVIVPNQNIFKVFKDKCEMKNVFKYVDGVLSSCVRGICDIITKRGDINIDFADIRTVMSDRGIIHMGVGFGKGDNKFTDALNMATKNPLLETTIKGAKEVILNFYGDNIDIFKLNECSQTIADLVDPDCEIIWGYREPVGDVAEKDFIEVTIIATDFGDEMTRMEATSDELSNFAAFGNLSF